MTSTLEERQLDQMNVRSKEHEIGRQLDKIARLAIHAPQAALDEYAKLWRDERERGATTSKVEQHPRHETTRRRLQEFFNKSYKDKARANRNISSQVNIVQSERFEWSEALSGLRLFATFGRAGMTAMFLRGLRDLARMRRAGSFQCEPPWMTFTEALQFLEEVRWERVKGIARVRGSRRDALWQPSDCVCAAELATERLGVAHVQRPKLQQKRVIENVFALDEDQEARINFDRNLQVEEQRELGQHERHPPDEGGSQASRRGPPGRTKVATLLCPDTLEEQTETLIGVSACEAGEPSTAATTAVGHKNLEPSDAQTERSAISTLAETKPEWWRDCPWYEHIVRLHHSWEGSRDLLQQLLSLLPSKDLHGRKEERSHSLARFLHPNMLPQQGSCNASRAFRERIDDICYFRRDQREWTQYERWPGEYLDDLLPTLGKSEATPNPRSARLSLREKEYDIHNIRIDDEFLHYPQQPEVFASPTGAFTDLHIDHYLVGIAQPVDDTIKLFATWPGTEHNLETLERAGYNRPQRLEKVVDDLEGGRAFVVDRDHPLFLPSSCIHAVVTLRGGFMYTVNGIVVSNGGLFLRGLRKTPIGISHREESEISGLVENIIGQFDVTLDSTDPEHLMDFLREALSCRDILDSLPLKRRKTTLWKQDMAPRLIKFFRSERFKLLCQTTVDPEAARELQQRLSN